MPVPVVIRIDDDEDKVPVEVPLGTGGEIAPSAPEATLVAMSSSGKEKTTDTPAAAEEEPPRCPEGPSSSFLGDISTGDVDSEETEDELTLGGSLSDLISPVPHSFL